MEDVDNLIQELKFQQGLLYQDEVNAQQRNQQINALNNEICKINKKKKVVITGLIIGYLLECLYFSEWQDLGSNPGLFFSDFLVSPIFAENQIASFGPAANSFFIKFGIIMIIGFGISFGIFMPIIRQRTVALQGKINKLNEEYQGKLKQLRKQLQGHPRYNIPTYSSYYLDRLVQILTTGQAKDLGTAIKLLETRLSNEQVVAASKRAELAAKGAERAANAAANAAADAAADAAYYSRW